MSDSAVVKAKKISSRRRKAVLAIKIAFVEDELMSFLFGKQNLIWKYFDDFHSDCSCNGRNCWCFVGFQGRHPMTYGFWVSVCPWKCRVFLTHEEKSVECYRALATAWEVVDGVFQRRSVPRDDVMDISRWVPVEIHLPNAEFRDSSVLEGEDEPIWCGEDYERLHMFEGTILECCKWRKEGSSIVPPLHWTHFQKYRYQIDPRVNTFTSFKLCIDRDERFERVNSLKRVTSTVDPLKYWFRAQNYGGGLMRCALYRLATPVKYIWRRGGEVKTGVLEEDGILHVFMREFEFPSSDCIVFSSGTNIIRCLDPLRFHFSVPLRWLKRKRYFVHL